MKTYEDDFASAIFDDLNTPLAITVLDRVLDPKAGLSWDEINRLTRTFDDVLGLKLKSIKRTDLRIRPKSATITEPEIDAILAQRREARAAKDFDTSDALRDELAGHGVEVMDGDPLGWDWKLGD